MDRKWMSKDRREPEYEKGVEDFIAFAIRYAKDINRILCPCVECCFLKRVSVEELRDHLIIFGIDQSYTNWVRHVEVGDLNGDWGSTMSDDMQELDTYSDDQLEDLARVLMEDLRDCPEMFENLKHDANEPLYPGCKKYTKLSSLLQMYNVKASGGWSDESFTKMLKLVKDMLPDGNTCAGSTYEAKKRLSSMGMSYQKIHACPNDCILYRNEYALLKSCPECGVSRYRKKKKGIQSQKEGVPAKVLWYFPIIPRFRRLFSNSEDAKNLVWHANPHKVDGRIRDGMMRHPADSPQWIKIDREFSEFGDEARNVRLALSTDGMNPFGGQRSSRSVWPVIIVIYNLPPWLCMKRKYMLLSMLISGPNQPGNNIDVYLAPLIEDLKMMWETGVEVFDANRNENFNLKAMLYGTINDFPAYGNLSGYSVKGYKACPICEENTSATYLNASHKVVYRAHRQFLPQNHLYRRLKKAFNGKCEHDKAPPRLTGEQVFDKVKGLDVKFGKTNAKFLPCTGYKKKSIFFELPYWKSLYVRHFLDVMHIEKNVFDSLIGTLLNMRTKTKDTETARQDLVDMGIREKLHPMKRKGRTYLPPACHTLSKKEKVAFCKLLSEIKVPDGYSSNISNLVSGLSLVNLKSHDCHILMEDILPVAIQSILPQDVRRSIIKLCLFFKEISRKVINPGKLNLLQKELVVTLCELEMFFPPAFFDIMVHLTVHLVKETQLCGPAYLRWMYPIERFMKVLKGYVMNYSRPEGCIVQRSIVEEALDFCSHYLSNMDPIGLPKSRGNESKGIIGNKVECISRETWRQAHLYVLQNSAEVEPYEIEHKNSLRFSYPTKSEAFIAREHNRTFVDWFREQIFEELEQDSDSVCDKLKWLSQGPRFEVLSYSGYQVNGYTFYTKNQDEQSTMQNSGVTLKAEAMHISSVKDKNPVYATMPYYGVIETIWELDYKKFTVPVFGCKWVDNNSGVQLDDYGFTLVNLTKVGYKDEPFILASQARQVFFVTLCDSTSVVISANKRNDIIDHEDDDDRGDELDDIYVGSNFPVLPTLNDDINEDELCIRHDHSEGLWIRPRKRRQITIAEKFRRKHSKKRRKF